MQAIRDRLQDKNDKIEKISRYIACNKSFSVYIEWAINGSYIGKTMFLIHPNLFPAGVTQFKDMIVNGINQSCKYCSKKYLMIELNNDERGGERRGRRGTAFINRLIPDPCSDIDQEDYVSQDYLSHHGVGIISLVPVVNPNDMNTDITYYSSQFMVILDNLSKEEIDKMDKEQIAIGYIIDGMDVLANINSLLLNSHRNKKMNICIIDTGLNVKRNPGART